MLYNHQLYSLIQLLFSTLCACERILSLDMFIAYSAEKNREAEKTWGHSLVGFFSGFHLSYSSTLFSRVNVTDN